MSNDAPITVTTFDEVRTHRLRSVVANAHRLRSVGPTGTQPGGFQVIVMGAWNGWYHVNGTTYGTWLPGDARGWRERHHRRHVEGDYKNPPAPGLGEGLRKHARKELKRPPVRLDRAERREAGRALVEMLVMQGVEVLALSIDAVHYHLLARFPDAQVRPRVGRAKKHAYHRLRDGGHEGEVWTRLCHVKPVRDRAHQLKVFEYILSHGDKDAWVWTFRDGMYRPGADLR